MKSVLNLAFLHLSVKYADPESNRELILERFAEAAALGADFVITPEMATSGYAFDNPAHAATYAETLDGRFISELRNRCAKTGCWTAVGMPLKYDGIEAVHNGAVIIDEKGEVRVVYHKVMAESPWATPGGCNPQGVVETPWGRVGILICSDTYYGLLPRIRKLQGADLLIVPANWPSSTLDPKRLWSVHARLNGMYVAVCNRTGKDRTLDCLHAVSCCFSPNGDALFQGQNHESTTFTVSIPLYNGKIKTPPCIPSCHAIKALDFKEHSVSSSLIDIKQAGKNELAIHACAGRHRETMNTWSEAWPPMSSDETRNSVLICFECREENEMPTGCRAAFKSSGMVRVQQLAQTACSIDFLPDTPVKTIARSKSTLPIIQQVNGITIGIITYEMTRYPEYLFCLAQSGCDVCVVMGDVCGHTDDIIYNCVHRMVIVYSKDQKTHIAIPPNGHETWFEKLSDENGGCSAIVPFDAVRNKEWLKKIAHCLAECIKPVKT